MKAALVFALMAIACREERDAGSASTTRNIPLGTSGMVFEAPKSWKLDTSLDRPSRLFYAFMEEDHAARGAPMIVEYEGSIGTVEDAVRSECVHRDEIRKGTLSIGGFWFSCKGESPTFHGVVTTRFPQEFRRTKRAISIAT